MTDQQSVVVVGGSSGIGLAIAKLYAGRGNEVIISSRDQGRADAAAAGVGGNTRGLALDLAAPATLKDGLASVEKVDRLVLVAIERDNNNAADYNIENATRLVTLKLVGYTEAIHTLLPKMTDEASVVLFGGLAKEKPYPGSTTITTVNGGVTSMIRTLAVELAPVRFNAIHPGVIGDTPAWTDKQAALDAVSARTPGGRLATTEDVVGAVDFLLGNKGVNGVNLAVDGGWLLM